jgi:hypothetical protein
VAAAVRRLAAFGLPDGIVASNLLVKKVKKVTFRIAPRAVRNVTFFRLFPPFPTKYLALVLGKMRAPGVKLRPDGQPGGLERLASDRSSNPCRRMESSLLGDPAPSGGAFFFKGPSFLADLPRRPD